MIDIQFVSEWINNKSVLQADLVSRQMEQSKIIKQQQLFLNDLEEAAEAIRNIARETQQQVKFKIAEAGSLMLQSVFDPAPEVHVEFETKRNQTECQINFMENGELFSPLDEDGFGKCDIGGIGLRVAIWSLPSHRSRPVMILDEPTKHLKGNEANIAAIQAIKKISEQLDIQIMMISDERVPFEEIEKGADRVFEVSMINKKSYMKVMK